MIANPSSRSPGSIPNNRREPFAPPVPILRRATPPPRRVPSSGKRLEGWSHATIVPILPLPARPILPPPGPCPHPHETRVNRTSCAQNDPPFTALTPLPSPRKSTFRWEAPECPNPSLPVPPPLGVLRVLGDLCVKLGAPLPALPILPPPSPGAHPHETRVNRTSWGQTGPPFTTNKRFPSPRKSTFPSPESDQPPAGPAGNLAPFPSSSLKKIGGGAPDGISPGQCPPTSSPEKMGGVPAKSVPPPRWRPASTSLPSLRRNESHRPQNSIDIFLISY